MRSAAAVPQHTHASARLHAPAAAPAPACARARRWAGSGTGVAQPRSAPLPSAASPAPHTAHRVPLGDGGAPPSPAHLTMDPCVPVARQWGCTPVHASARSRARGDTARSHVCSPGPQRAVRPLREACRLAGPRGGRARAGGGESQAPLRAFRTALHLAGLVGRVWSPTALHPPRCRARARPPSLGSILHGLGDTAEKRVWGRSAGLLSISKMVTGRGEGSWAPRRRSRSCGTELSADLLPQLFIGTMGRTCFNDICAGAQQRGSAPSQKEYVSGFTDGKSSASLTGARSPRSLHRAPPALRRAHPRHP